MGACGQLGRTGGCLHVKKVWLLAHGESLQASMSHYLIERIRAQPNIEVLMRTRTQTRHLKVFLYGKSFRACFLTASAATRTDSLAGRPFLNRRTMLDNNRDRQKLFTRAHALPLLGYAAVIMGLAVIT